MLQGFPMIPLPTSIILQGFPMIPLPTSGDDFSAGGHTKKICSIGAPTGKCETILCLIMCCHVEFVFVSGANK